MNLRYYPPDKLKADLLAIAGRHLDLTQYRLFFFGSRVTGKGDDHSDVDVGVEGPGPVPPDKIRAIKEELEKLPSLYKIDFVDFAGVSEEFRKVAQSAREVIK